MDLTVFRIKIFFSSTKVDVNLQNKDGKTALTITTKQGNESNDRLYAVVTFRTYC